MNVSEQGGSSQLTEGYGAGTPAPALWWAALANRVGNFSLLRGVNERSSARWNTLHRRVDRRSLGNYRTPFSTTTSKREQAHPLLRPVSLSRSRSTMPTRGPTVLQRSLEEGAIGCGRLGARSLVVSTCWPILRSFSRGCVPAVLGTGPPRRP